MFKSRFWRVSTLIATTAGVAGCTSNLVYEPHLVEKHSDAGAFTVAATMVDTWDNFVGELSPNFTLDEEDALKKAIPRTGVSETQMLDALGLEARVAPPTSSTERTVTERLTAEGTTETTGEETTTEGPGDLSGAQPPTAPGSSLTQQAATKLPPKAGETVEIDPFLKYTVATGLYQEVKLLNNAVRAAARRHKMVPYILRLQMNNVPYARHQPYDTYAAISLFAREVCAREPGGQRDPTCRGKRDRNWDTGWRDREAVVVPLLVTDNLESLLSSRTSDVVRQIATAASILRGGFAASLGLTRKTEELNAVLSNDLNSLMTAGRTVPSSLYVRLGAMQEATARYAMVPRNYSVTTLVLVPEDRVPGGRIDVGDIEGIRITGSVEYRNAETGEPLERQPGADRVELVRKALADTTREAVPVTDKEANDLLIATYVNAYDWFEETASGLRHADGAPAVHAPANLWNAILERIVSAGFFGATVHLPKTALPRYPPAQTVLLLDNGADRTTARLRGGQGLSAETLDASLTIPLAGGGTATIPAEDIRIGRHGGNPVLVFPSFAVWGVKPRVAGAGSTHVRGAQLELDIIEGGEYERTRQAPSGAGVYSDAHYRIAEEAEGGGS